MCFVSMMSNAKGTQQAFEMDQQLVAGRGNRPNEVAMLNDVGGAYGLGPSAAGATPAAGTGAGSNPAGSNAGRQTTLAGGTTDLVGRSLTSQQAANNNTPQTALKKLMGA